jgi:hypothetical protein
VVSEKEYLSAMMGLLLPSFWYCNQAGCIVFGEFGGSYRRLIEQAVAAAYGDDVVVVASAKLTGVPTAGNARARKLLANDASLERLHPPSICSSHAPTPTLQQHHN